MRTLSTAAGNNPTVDVLNHTQRFFSHEILLPLTLLQHHCNNTQYEEKRFDNRTTKGLKALKVKAKRATQYRLS